METVENKYITLAYKLYTIENGEKEFTCCFQFFENELFELFQFGVTVSGFFCFCHSFNILFVIMLY